MLYESPRCTALGHIMMSWAFPLAAVIVIVDKNTFKTFTFEASL